MISIKFTYDTIIDGELVDYGYCDHTGQKIGSQLESPEEAVEAAEMWTETGDLEHFIRQAIDLGIHAPSSLPDITTRTWFSSVDGDTQYSLHIHGLTDCQMKRVADIFEQRYVGEDAGYWLECTERSILTQSFLNSLPPSILDEARVVLRNISQPENERNLLLALASNCPLTSDMWLKANELLGLYQEA